MKKCTRLLLCSLSLAVTSCALPSAIPMTASIRAPGVDPRYAPLIEEMASMTRRTMSRNRIPGLSIVLVDSRGPIWEAGFGYAEDGRTIPVDGDTMFSIQSMSKTFTAVGVLTALRDGALDLDTPITRYLPDFTVGSIFEHRPQDRITLRHLLTHTAGFTHEAPAGNNYDPSEPSFDEHVDSISATWLLFRVGERAHYSNLGTDLAGAALQAVCGRPLPDCMRERVFEPLGLTRTTMDPVRILSATNRATGHMRRLRQLPVVVPMMAAGGVYSSAHDLGTFLSFMLREGRGGDDLLSVKEFRELQTTPNHGSSGLGIGIGRRRDDLYFTHGGGGYGFLCVMAWHPTLDIGIAVLTNSSEHDSAHVRLAESIVDQLVAAGMVSRKFPLTYLPVCAITLEGATDDAWYFDAHPGRTAWREEWGRYTGSYQLGHYGNVRPWAGFLLSLGMPRAAFVKVRRQDQGMVLDGVPLLEQEPGLFFTMDGEALDFRGDPPTWRNIRLRKR